MRTRTMERSDLKNEIAPFAAPWMQAESIALSMSERRREAPHDVTYTWNRKYGTNKPVSKTETESRTWRTGVWFLAACGEGEEWTGSLGEEIATFRVNKQQGPTVEHTEL